MKSKGRNRLLSLIICICIAFAFSSCVKNDLPYPVVRLSITGFEVNGQIGSAVINNEERTVTVDLLDSVDLKKVIVTRFDYSEEANTDLKVNTTIDLSSPKEVVLSLYQDYRWKIIANQTVERVFSVKNQVGGAVIDEKARQAIVYVNKNTMLNKITVKDLKLGPISSTVSPDFTTLKDFTQEQKVNVTFKGKNEEWSLYAFITDKVVFTNSADGWTNVAWLYGEGQEDVVNGFEIREASSEEWTRVDQDIVVQNGVNFYVCVPHLKADTEYVCRALVDGTEDRGEEITFRTTAAIPLTGGTFDNWNQSGKVWNPWGSNETPFWDTGNQGATTLGDSNSVPTEDIWSGKTTGMAAKLESKFVGVGSAGKLAAGNLFVGKYVATDGTNGILNFGQSFSAYPTHLKGYYKYQPGVIDNSSIEYNYLKGRTDTCSIYIAIGDWDSPIEIRTKPSNRKLFDKNDKHVIAYAEFTSGTPVAVYKEFDLKLEYRATNRKPTYIVLVCSASKYGDFFTGASGSVLYVDEFSLEYDYDN